MAKDDKSAPGVASERENAKLEHTVASERGEKTAVTTRDDHHDLGAPMLQGSGEEPVGPEDALGPGKKRGDYSQKVGPEDYQPHEAQVLEGGGEVVYDDDGNAVDLKPVSDVVAQRPRVAERGEVAGKKGGVETG